MSGAIAIAQIVSSFIRTMAQQAMGRLFPCKVCGVMVWASEAYVPPVDELYRYIRESAVDTNLPLTVSELATETRCRKHRPKQGFPLVATLGVMDRWVASNARDIAREQAAAVVLPRPIQKSCLRILGPVGFIINGQKPAVVKPTPAYRLRAKGPSTHPRPRFKKGHKPKKKGK